MNNENHETRVGKLEQLSEETRAWVLQIAAESRLVDAVDALKECGIDVSVPTLSRFVRKHRVKELVEDTEEMRTTAATLAERGKESGFRVVTLEAVRQRLYERAMDFQSPDEARELYTELVREEAKLRELDLETRRVAVAEEQVKVQRLRAEAEIAARRQKAIVTASEAVVEVVSEGTGAPKQLAERSGGEEKWMKLFGEIVGILNRGGAPEERVLEARARLAEALQ